MSISVDDLLKNYVPFVLPTAVRNGGLPLLEVFWPASSGIAPFSTKYYLYYETTCPIGVFYLYPLGPPSMNRFRRSVTQILISLFLVLVAASDVWGIDGNNPGAIDGENGWKAFELVTENDSLSGLTLGQSYTPGSTTASGTFSWISGIHNHWDGLGAYTTDANNLRVLVNHEGTDDATVTAVDIATSTT